MKQIVCKPPFPIWEIMIIIMKWLLKRKPAEEEGNLE